VTDRVVIEEHAINLAEPFEIETREGAQPLAIQRRRFGYVLQFLVDHSRPKQRRRYEIRPEGDQRGSPVYLQQGDERTRPYFAMPDGSIHTLVELPPQDARNQKGQS